MRQFADIMEEDGHLAEATVHIVDYIEQCRENCHLDSGKIILDSKHLIIMGASNNDLFIKRVQYRSQTPKRRV